MKTSSSIAVLMTCYNRVETTLRCLHSLFNQTIKQTGNQAISLDVWLVDDASPDQTGAKVKAAFPEVHVIEGAGGLFWCKGMRLAWDTAAAAKDLPKDIVPVVWSGEDLMEKELDYFNSIGYSVLYAGFYDADTVDCFRGIGSMKAMKRAKDCCGYLYTSWKFRGNFELLPAYGEALKREFGPLPSVRGHSCHDNAKKDD